MFKFLGRLFSSNTALEKGVDAAIKGVDAVFYTEEEKATDRKETLKQVGKLVVEWMTASQGHRLARRLIAVSITFTWILMYVLCGFMSVVAAFVEKPQSFRDSGEELYNYATSMNGAVMLILGFYFAAPYMGDLVKSAVTKFRGRNDK